MFNSRDPQYKNPVGASKLGEQIHFKISLPRAISCSAAWLIVEKDGTREKRLFDMFWCGMKNDNEEWWECDFTPANTGLYFYYFEVKTSRGHKTMFRDNIGGVSTITPNGNRWQQTVYDGTYKNPEWLKGGIMYQIFPDRFYNSGTKKHDIPDGRIMRDDWGAEPGWRPNEKGEVLCNDYFGGDLKGIEMKLPYLKSLGVTCIYLNPIFEAHSNHRYNTADYSKIDPVLGDEEDFRSLCKEAKKLGIHILLDGVFSHTGSDSIYFNKEGRYPSDGAYNSKKSPFFNWYNFREWPENYECWWDFTTLPNVKETNPEYNEYINGADGIVKKWLDAGASGWRLDVADELPDEFLYNLNKAAKEANPDALILGEVWEDASNKSAYGERRKYLLGNQLDSVMNYPFREAIIGFLNGEHSSMMMEMIENIVENYPPHVVKNLMNHIGTHDTERIITMLADEPTGINGREWQSGRVLSKEKYELGLAKLRLAALLQYTLPGVPCIYYGDEIGMQGYKDPFCRKCFEWENINSSLLYWYKRLGIFRTSYSIFQESGFRNVYSHGNVMSFERYRTLDNGDEEIMLVAVNRADGNATIPIKYDEDAVIEHVMGASYDKKSYRLSPYGFSVLHIIKKKK
ncbi:MAG: glycoside hydrolase family 13 protein [Clostridia bacterium]|nr:glycoside hydrolase family 13 protein [Clostridia bacterium]